MNHLQIYKQIKSDDYNASWRLKDWVGSAMIEVDIERCLSDAMQLLAFCKQRILDEKQLLLIGNSNTLENE